MSDHITLNMNLKAKTELHLLHKIKILVHNYNCLKIIRPSDISVTVD